VAIVAIAGVCAGFSSACGTAPEQATGPAGLSYDEQTRGPAPIPPSERELQTAAATPWFKVSNQSRTLEGAIFDRDGNMLFCDASISRISAATQPIPGAESITHPLMPHRYDRCSPTW
jgi:lactonase